jgi:hypothetical protein
MMTVVESYQRLWSCLHELREPWLELRLTVSEDVPRQGDALAADEIGDRVDDGLAALEVAVASAAKLVEGDPPLRAAGELLDEVAGQLAQVSRTWRELARHERQVQLTALGRRRGPEWSAWVVGVQGALASLPDRLETTESAWRAVSRELLERASWAIDQRTTPPAGEPPATRESEGRRA